MFHPFAVLLYKLFIVVDVEMMLQFESFIDQLVRRLSEPLPGLSAHLRMIPSQRLPEFERSNDCGKRASVLLLVYPYRDDIYTVLIRRPEYNGHHSGQIALPGGKHQPEDSSVVDTALREAREEVGIYPAEVNVLAELTQLFIPPSNFLLTPVLAWQDRRPDFVADSREVAEICEVKLRDFNPTNRAEKEIQLSNGRFFLTPYYNVNQLIVWGATAMILSEWEELARELWKQ